MNPASLHEHLRILHVMPTITVGGAEQMAAHLMIGLSQSHAVGAVGLFAASNSPVERRLADSNIPQWHLNKRRGFDPGMFSSLGRVFREFQPHVVHTHMAVQRYVFPLLLRNRIAAVHTIHNLAEHETDAVGRLVHWFAFRNHVLPIGISQEVAASVNRLYGMPCRAVIPNCIPVDHYGNNATGGAAWRERQGIDAGAVVFTSVARLEPQKNPLLALKALAKVRDTRAHLVMIGDGSLREQVAAYVQSNNLKSRVHLLGKQNDIPSVLAASDVFVLGSNWEGNPLAVMEAMAAGLPVIATAVGGVPELVRSGEDGILVQAGDWSGLSDAMQSLLDDPQKRMAMGAAAQTRAFSEFRVERMVRQYADLYRDAVTMSRGTRSRELHDWPAAGVEIQSEQSK